MSNFTPQSSNTNHKVTEDKLVQALHQTRPVGSSQHRDELEARLLGLLEAQSQSTDERHPNMQAQARSNIIPIRKIRVSPILVATLAMILLGAGLLLAYGSASPPDEESSLGQGIGTDTATPIPAYTLVPGVDELQMTALAPDNQPCQLSAIGIATSSIPVYAQDSTESEQLGSFSPSDTFLIIGQNYGGDWLVVDWSLDYVGWIENSSSPEDLTIITCAEQMGTIDASGSNHPNDATVDPLYVLPTATPISLPPASDNNCKEAYRVSTALLLTDTDVYALPDINATVLTTFASDTLVEVVGVNYEQDWFVINLNQEFIGWIPIKNIQFVACEHTHVSDIMPAPTYLPPTVVPPAYTATPIPTYQAQIVTATSVVMTFQASIGTTYPTAVPMTEIQSCPNSALLGTARSSIFVYANDTTESDLLGIYPAYTQFLVIGQNVTSDWYMVQWSADTIGWIENLSSGVYKLEPLDCTQINASHATSIAFPPTAVPPSDDSDMRVTATPTVPPPQMTATSIVATFFATLTGVPDMDEFEPTVVPPEVESCPFASIGTAQDDVTVYALDSTESDELDTFAEGEQFMIIGQNYTGDWLVVQWIEDYVGWVQTPVTDDAEFTTITCEDLLDTVQDVDFNDMTATALPPTAIPTSTPIGTEAMPESCELHLVRTAQLLNETTVYARPGNDADVLDTLAEDTIIEVIGVNRGQDWFVIKLDAGYVGWIHIDEMQFLGCERGNVTEIMIDPTAFPPTVVPPSDDGNMNVTATSSPFPTEMPTATPIPSN